MNRGVKVLVFPVKDLTKAKEIYGTLMGVEPSSDSPYYVGYKVADVELGLDPNGHASGLSGPVAYSQVSDINASLKALLDAGAKPHQSARDVGDGRLIATVKDADGNVLGLMQ